MKTSASQKKIRARALRLRRALASEERRLGGAIDDGAGTRYMIGPLFVQCGDLEAALKHYAWFEEACHGDIGEPIHALFWALALYRVGDEMRAREKLLDTMVQNIYLLPSLLGLPVSAEDIWHSSNWAELDYVHATRPEFVPRLSREEGEWIAGLLASDLFRRMKTEYISTFAALKDEHDVKRRIAILDRWERCWDERFALDG
jgi:hypothetical protein